MRAIKGRGYLCTGFVKEAGSIESRNESGNDGGEERRLMKVEK